MKEPVFIAADHAGFDLKEKLKIARPQITWIDLGPYDTSRVDYPDYATRLAEKISNSSDPGQARGVLICGSGQGMAIRANRYAKVRAGLVWNEESVKLAREHNDINVLCLGARLLDHDLAFRLVDVFLMTPFAGGRHADRVEKLSRPC